MNRNRSHCRSGILARQKGFAFMLALLLIVIASAGIFYNLVTPAKQALESDEKTNAALAQAKEALIGYATDVDLSVSVSSLPRPTTAPRPGGLPCPDRNNDGLADGPCLNASGSTLGRLPWKTLGLPDLRDGAGERLWYAVSVNFNDNSPAGVLNSDARGTITIRDNSGTIVNDGTNPDPYTPSGVIAVVLSPGSILQRQGAGTRQDRSCTGDSNIANCNATNVCTGPTYTATALCNPVNYLDVVGPPVLTVAGAAASSEDNANFTDSVTTNGFIGGDIRDSSNNPVVNDRLLTITYSNLMPLLERRVAREVFSCLSSYAADPQNKGRYPWAADITLSASGNYSDQMNNRFGRVPATFSQTILGLSIPILAPVITPVCLTTESLGLPVCMRSSWPPSPSCNITVGSWWSNWRELVFYAVSDAYKPGVSLNFLNIPIGVPATTGGCGSCLKVNPPSSAADKQFAVMVAGKQLAAVAGGQPRSIAANKSVAANYLEGDNDWTAGLPNTPDGFNQQSTSASFNDYLLFK